jgi:hypothetical protein
MKFAKKSYPYQDANSFAHIIHLSTICRALKECASEQISINRARLKQLREDLRIIERGGDSAPGFSFKIDLPRFLAPPPAARSF